MAKSVLIVDDDPDQHLLVGLYMENAGYTVFHAYDGGEGFDVALMTRPSLVLMDMRMPRTNGEQAFQRLLADPATRDIPVVAVTADVMAWPESRSLREGFAGHVSKPCDLSRIRDLVWRIIGTADAPPPARRAAFVAARMQ